MDLSNTQRWLDTAVSGIRFGPDRRAVRGELEAHLEDKIAGLGRSFPEIPEEEAIGLALTAMGDPEELKRQLAKLHKPWLGRLWVASRWTLGTLAVLAVVALGTPDEASKNPLAGGYRGYERESYQQCGVPDRPQPEQAELGGYTFQIIDAAYLDYPEELASYTDSIQMVFRASSPRFWERVDPMAVYGALTVTTPDGRRFPMGQAVETPEEEPAVTMEPARWGLFFRDFYIYIHTEDWKPGDRVTLDFDFPLGSFTLSAGVAERVVME